MNFVLLSTSWVPEHLFDFTRMA